MDGLECNEIPYSYVKNTLTLRYDAEYYQKSYIDIEKFISCHRAEFKSIEELGLNVDASAFYPSLEPFYNTGDVPFIRVADVKNYIDYNSCICIPIMGNDFSTLHKCFPGDIVLTKGGRVGTSGLITKSSYVTRDLITIDSSRLSRERYITLYLYLSSNFAFLQMLRSSSMTAQPHLTITLIKTLLIKEFSHSFQFKMEKLYDKSENALLQAQGVYADAEKILSRALTNLTELTDTALEAESNISIKTLKNSFSVSGRLDAEYYQSKYDAIEKKLNTRETVLLLCNLHDKNFTPNEKQTYQYIELADVGQSGDISDVTIQLGGDLPTRARRKVKTGQVIVSSVEGSLQSCALITDEYDGALCSTGFYVLDSDNINSETLLVLFKSEPIQALMKQRCSGTILTAISKDELLSMPLPMIDENIQKEITAKVQESFALRKQSKQLLEYAKQAVEMAIEKGENSALDWLKDKIPAEV